MGYSGLTWPNCSVSLQPIDCPQLLRSREWVVVNSPIVFRKRSYKGQPPGKRWPKVSATYFPTSYQRSCSKHSVRRCPARPPCVILKGGLDAHIQWDRCCSHAWGKAMSRSHEISTPVGISLSYRAHPVVLWHQNLLQDPQQSAPEELISAPCEFRAWSFLGNQNVLGAVCKPESRP